jgi:phosphatidylethanolamine-binding protein (PEBP) family uncharacterized protein
MPFSSSICLTNIGTLPLGSNVDIYSNANNYSSAFKTNVSLSDLTSNCPYILTEIPDGTTEIKFEDTVSHCCYNLIISPNNLCNLFGIQLSGFSSTTISQIVAGQLINSVGANITDYVIDWYGPDDNTTIAFTSGFGTGFTNVNYQQTHPFVRLSPAGYYIPMIRQIRINGINYSKTGGTGFVQANINCLENQTVTVFPSNCLGNRQSPYFNQVQYNNFYFSDTAAFNAPPETLYMDFDLDFDTNYFAWAFRAFLVSDTVEISFISDIYSSPIVLEYWTLGTQSTETNLLSTPKVVRVNETGYFKKVINLKPLLRTQNDKIRVRVTPNQTNSRTNWELYFKCLNTFDCETCLDTTQLPYKFIDTSIIITSGTCNQYLFQGSYTSCTQFDFNTTDLRNYLVDGASYYDFGVNQFCFTSNIYGVESWSEVVSTGGTRCTDSYIYWPTSNVCFLPDGGVTTFAKTQNISTGDGEIYMEFYLFSDFQRYYNSYLDIVSYGLGTPNDNTNINYYRYFHLYIPIIPSTDPFRPCASDVSNVGRYRIHTSSIVTTGQTGDFTWMRVTMPRITRNINFTNCELECNTLINQYVDAINQDSISINNQYNFVSNVGAKFIRPFTQYQTCSLYQTGEVYGQKNPSLYLNSVINETIPMSGSNYTIIPSLSSTTCDFSSYKATNTTYNPLVPNITYTKDAAKYLVKITNTNHVQLFNNYPNLDNLLIYDYDVNTNTVVYSASSYFIGPSIKLISFSYVEGENIPITFKSNYCGQPNWSPDMRWNLNGFNTTSVSSYDILCEDTNAPGSSPSGFFIHWYVTGIDPTQLFSLQNGTWWGNPTENPTDYQPGFYADRANGWNGPCPPSGETHLYRIQITANLIAGGTIKSNYSTFTASTP